jgi:hypothetical protein
MIAFVCSFFYILVLVLIIAKIKWGVALFLAYFFVVPVRHVLFLGLELGENVLYLSFLVGYFFQANRKCYKTTLQPLIPFLIYFFLLLAIMPFQNEMPFLTMLNRWRIDFLRTLILPFVIWNLMVNDCSCIKLFRNTLLISIFIAVGYALFLITQGGINPYIMLFMDLLTLKQDMEAYYIAEGAGRLFGRISSVFVHPMQYALFLGLSIVYFFHLRAKINIYIYIVLIVALGLSAVTCGVRSVLGGLAITFFYYFLKVRRFEMVFFVIVLTIFFYSIIKLLPEMSSYLGSIFEFDNSNNDVAGSSIDMRFSQLDGAIKEASRNPMFGLGYGWTEYYKSIHGDHPICLAFESLIYVIVCDWGWSGFIIWVVLLFLYFRNNRNMNIADVLLPGCLIIFYIIYSCITGDSAYMRYFLLFYIIMQGDNMESKLTLNHK